ncbi:hypothetical protein B8V81_2762 [Paenibacillus pasadenensis]|uniref:Uncharacterized protein n=1 Tax=Paenibacillus pasadenensis TaxID=217090 RepID=A0A2N5N1W4_9BACL|nr:hypothetical protein B8V81_2762 [Paenibacillus pasadenensis]
MGVWIRVITRLPSPKRAAASEGCMPKAEKNLILPQPFGLLLRQAMLFSSSCDAFACRQSTQIRL